MDYRLYFITTENQNLGRSHTATALAAAKGGATMIQFRDKTMSNAEFEKTALAIKEITDAREIPLIINDRVAIGVKIGADGVHVGQGDLNLRKVRAVAGPYMLVGCSARSVEEARRGQAEGADYIGAGPVFLTGSKDDAAAPIGLTELERICEAVDIPVVAIGGIDGGNIDGIIKSGAAGTAVIAAVAGAPDMEKAAFELKRKWENR